MEINKENEAAYLDLFLDMFDELAVWLDRELLIGFVNKAFADKLGYSSDELAGVPYETLLPAADKDRFHNVLCQARQAGKREVELEHGLIHKNGTADLYLVTGVFSCLPDGCPGVMLRLKRAIGQYAPFGERDSSGAGKAESYKMIVEASPVPIFIQTDQKFAYLNPSACAFFGVSSPEELIGTPVFDRFRPQYKDVLQRRIRRLNEERLPPDTFFEYQFITAAGEVWAETSGVPFEYEGKNGALVFLRDVTKRKAIEKALLASEKKFEHLFSDSAVPALVARLPDHAIVEVNDAWLQLFGFTRNETIGKTALELGVIRDFIRDERILNILNSERNYRNFESRQYTKTGDELILISNISITEYNGETYALITNQDITERKHAEAALFELSERYRSSFEHSALAACLMGIDGQLKNVNKMMCQVFGYTKEELVGRNITDLSNPEDILLSNAAVKKMLSGKSDAETIQKRYIRRNGEVFWANVTGALVRDIENQPLHFIIQLQDITENQRLMEELRASEEFARTVMDNLPIGISVNSYKPPLAFSYMNDKFPEFYGTTREALYGVDVFFDAVYEDPAFRENIRRKILDDMSSGDPSRMRWENVPITHQGQVTRYVNAYNKSIPEKDLHISIVTDETGRVRALEAIKKNAARLQAIHEFDLAILRGFESLHSIGENALRYLFELLEPDTAEIGILGLDDTVMHVVRSSKGQQTAERYEKVLNELELSQLAGIADPLLHSRDEKPPAVISHIFKCPGMCNCSSIPIFASGRLRGIINIGYNPPAKLSGENAVTVQEMATQVALAIEQTRLLRVTELYATSLEQMIHERTAELEEINQELESFTFSVSHDLRVPLRSMYGFIRILQEDYGRLLDDEGRRICDVIAGSAQNMGQLIDDLLALSRVGRTSLETSEVDMRAMAERVYIDLTNDDQRSLIDFSVGDLPAACADHRLIRQVWVNLIDNAVKFSSKREKPKIKITAEANGGEIVYAVEDNGAGFNMTYKDKLFGVFQRLHSQKEFDGTGVGLAIVSRIIRRHGGRIWANGMENVGATFYFSLKRAEGNDDARRR